MTDAMYQRATEGRPILPPVGSAWTYQHYAGQKLGPGPNAISAADRAAQFKVAAECEQKEQPVSAHFIGRVRPYTARGIRRIPCTRCGASSYSTWQVCANGGRHVPVCKPCDVALNHLALDFLRHPHREALMGAYRLKTDV